MNTHYYTQNPEIKHHEKTWEFVLKKHKLLFTTDNGVFSKKTVDFGSRVLIEHFSTADLPTGAILDVGCGYGPIGLTLAKNEPTRPVEMVDVNELALSLAAKNAALNEITNVKIYASDCYQQVARKDFAAIVSNPPIRAGKEVVLTILVEAYDHLQLNGTLTIVIQKKQGGPSAKKKMTEVFGNVEVVAKDKGYYILRSVKED